jgi:hypothetical protein
MCVVGLLLVAIYLSHFAPYSRVSPDYVFELSQAPEVLTEDFALTKARETLTQAGFNGAAWMPREYDRTSAPGGDGDRFLKRSSDTPLRGIIIFSDGKAQRVVSISLEGSRVTCGIYHPK